MGAVVHSQSESRAEQTRAEQSRIGFENGFYYKQWISMKMNKAKATKEAVLPSTALNGIGYGSELVIRAGFTASRFSQLAG